MMRTLIGVSAALVLLVTFVVYLATTDSGRQLVAGFVERRLSGAIPGRVAIGSLVRLAPGDVQVRDLRFFDEDDKLVIEAKQVAIDPDPWALLGGDVVFHHARVEGGQVRIFMKPDSRTSMEHVFEGPGGGDDDGGDDRKGRIRVDIRALVVRNLFVLIKAGEDSRFRLAAVKGTLRVQLDESAPGVRVRLRKVSGKLVEPSFLGVDVAMTRIDGRIAGGVPHVVDLDLASRVGDDGHLTGHVSYFNRDETPVEVRLEPKEGILPAIGALYIWARSLPSQTVSIELGGA